MTFGDTSNPCNDLMLAVMAAVAQFERALLLERQREGIAIAKGAGKYQGRKPSLSDNDATAVARRLAEGESASALAREFGVSRATAYNTRVRLAASGVTHPRARNTSMKSARIAAAVAANTPRSEPTGESTNQ